jgi:hypothetical protein
LENVKSVVDIPDDGIADLSSLNAFRSGNVHTGRGKVVINRIVLSHDLTAAPVREFLRIVSRQLSRVGTHQVSSYSPSM